MNPLHLSGPTFAPLVCFRFSVCIVVRIDSLIEERHLRCTFRLPRHSMKTWLRAGLCALAAMTSFAPQSRAESLSVTNLPPGANAEISGVPVGTTSFPAEYPGGYLHKAHVVFSTRLDHSMALQSFEGRLFDAADCTHRWPLRVGCLDRRTPWKLFFTQVRSL
jgi:hypothetical protein